MKQMSKDSSFTMSTLLKNETTPFSKLSLWLRSRKIPVEPFLNLESEPSFHSPNWMKWILGGMYLELHHYPRGTQTYLKHSLSLFQVSLKMKPNPTIVYFCFKLVKKWKHLQVSSSIASHVSSLCRNETIPTLPLMIAILSAYFAKWALVFSFHRHHLFDRSYAFTWLFYPCLRNICDEWYY